MRMSLTILSSVVVGLLLGMTVLPHSWLAGVDTFTSWALVLMVFLVGISIGRNRDLFALVRSAGPEMVLLPAAGLVGSLGGGLLAGKLMGMPHNESLAVSAGFGWYTLSGVLIARLHSVTLGATAFLANVTRELAAVMLIPLLAGRGGSALAVAPGGATTMDTTLPLIARCTDPRVAVIAFFNGVVLSALVPVLVPLLLRT